MKKYLIAASLFAVNSEVLSWIALTAIVVMLGVDFLLAVNKELEKGGRDE